VIRSLDYALLPHDSFDLIDRVGPTAELRQMADWLKQCGIRTVALQSTGVYWIAVYDILEEAGLEVYLVNAARDEESARAQKRCAGESMVDDAAHLWLIAELASAIGGDPQAADLLAAAQ
jgi:hypothetical protein